MKTLRRPNAFEKFKTPAKLKVDTALSDKSGVASSRSNSNDSESAFLENKKKKRRNTVLTSLKKMNKGKATETSGVNGMNFESVA